VFGFLPLYGSRKRPDDLSLKDAKDKHSLKMDSLRDLFIIVIILGSLPICFLRPVMGIYMWYWVSFMNPHRFGWNYARYGFPIGLCIALATLLGFIFVQRKMSFPKQRDAFLIIALMVFLTFTTLFGILPNEAWPIWEQVIKILLMTIVTVLVIDDKEKLRRLLIVITLSIGFFGVKGAIWGIFTGGQYRLYGPMLSFISDNNAMGMALCMIIPIALFLFRTERKKMMRVLFLGVFVTSIFGVLLTYSRGGFLGLAVVLLSLTSKAKKKVISVGVIAILALVLISFMPEKWHERIGGTIDYKEDLSAVSRLEMWKWAWTYALEHPFIGGGFATFKSREAVRNVHSIYFGVLAEHGFIGLALFVGLILSAYRSCAEIKKMSRGNSILGWNAHLADMLQSSIIAYIVCGAFLNLQYFDLFYCIIAIIVIAKRLSNVNLNVQPKNYLKTATIK
jgi:putative inorganic carbon (HCO3(-)) transporter